MIKVLKKGDYALDDVLIRDRSGRDVSQVVADIIFGVKMGGDPTLINYSQTFDGPIGGALELTKEAIDAFVAELS
jgi:histidinol dehydrogenase